MLFFRTLSADFYLIKLLRQFFFLLADGRLSHFLSSVPSGKLPMRPLPPMPFHTKRQHSAALAQEGKYSTEGVIMCSAVNVIYMLNSSCRLTFMYPAPGGLTNACQCRNRNIGINLKQIVT